MDILHLSRSGRTLRGALALDGSKSLSNRALIALALAGADDPAQGLSNCSTATDTATLLHLLQHPADVYDAGDAGTAFRFLTAYLALRPGTQVLTGSARMLQRPIGPLVDALRTLGFDIRYLGVPGYPPLEIQNFKNQDVQVAGQLRVNAGISSQFLSALLLIGPYLPAGLKLIPVGGVVSRPYIDMTMHLMRYFGAEVAWQADGSIAVQPGGYQVRRLVIEADWSAASYWYAMAVFADEADLVLHGLAPASWQGDSVLASMLAPFGVVSEFSRDGQSVRLRKSGATALPEIFRQDFRDCPDLAQTLAVVCAGLGVPGIFSGLETLAIKETDRCAALTVELAKVGVHFEPDVQAPERYLLRGKASWQTPPRFATYGDHRMAMALASLSLFGPIELENPGVVRKSYPAFWEHLRSAGFCTKNTTEP
ncbi:MAG: 3-phosphoshikimate 1-carboxyvinyltransferase [Lewinellaceae bacterium]|nr:3-phosphoshikimate 1-carboxyvinyltransferase [Lewinellaceae bacterium]